MDSNLIWVLIGCALIGAGASIVGTFSYLRKEALAGDAIAHALLPGVALAFLLTEEKKLYVLFPGAIIAGLVSMWAIQMIKKYSKIKSDTAIALVLSVFFATGVVLLTHIQQGDYGNQSGLDAFLFGKAASMLPRDIYLFVTVDLIIVGLVALFYPYLKLYAFDQEFAESTGLPIRLLRFGLSVLTVLAIASGIQAVGVVLMAALIITPAATARFLSARMHHMLAIAVVIGVLSAIIGVYISYLTPSMPTGPWIVVVLSFFALSTFAFAPKKGIVHRHFRRIAHQRKIMDENVVKHLYHMSGSEKGIGLGVLSAERQWGGKQLEGAIKRLVSGGLIFADQGKVGLTDDGQREGARIVRLHRLWELYLSERMNIAEDHVHHDAEAIEHIITPELEQALLKELDYPEMDPHSSEIPGVKEMKSYES